MASPSNARPRVRAGGLHDARPPSRVARRAFQVAMSSPSKPARPGPYAEVPYAAALTTYLGYAVLIVFGYVRDATRGLAAFLSGRGRRGVATDRAELLNDFEDFYTRRLYLRIQDCWGRPISGTAGAWIGVLERVWAGKGEGETVTGVVRRCLNLGSYNYLGYAEVPGGVDESVVQCLRERGCSSGDVAAGAGRSDVVRELESVVADFLRKDDAVVVGMGFATNSQIIPAIVGPGDLIVSDANNHASIVVGARSSGAKIRVFEHNSAASLEFMLREAISNGQPRTGAPWKKILVVVEGMYSMEGETVKLRDIVAVKKKYNAYLYLDEAHSIGALGATGRGVCERYGVDTADVDVMMGTFTKSFGAIGGYIAGSSALVNRIRALSAASVYATAMSPPCAKHIIWAFNQISGRDGTDIGKNKIRALRENSIYFRQQLTKLGLQTLGDWDSPVIPIMLYNPAKIAAFSRECFSRGLAVVVVGFPATPLLLSRARICLSAAHTREDLDWALSVIDEVSELIQIKYNRSLIERFLPSTVSSLLFGNQRPAECLRKFAGHDHCAGRVCLIDAKEE